MSVSPVLRPPQPLKVIIAGGGIAGLVLAVALQQAEIDYVLLEARESVTVKIGWTIATFPNGNRILDQLSCYEPLWDHTVPIRSVHEHDEKGNFFRGEPSDLYQWLGRRQGNKTGYDTPFIERYHLLELLYSRIKDKSKILTCKIVTHAEESEEGVTVICSDGSVFQGAVLAGADGVHSKIRSEMWRIADERVPGFIPGKDKTAMYAEYRCLFGITKPKKMLAPPGTEQDAIQFAKSIADFPIQDDGEYEGKCVFGDIWDDQHSFLLVPLEEAQHHRWTYGRIVLLGDSVHKGTANVGPGGNSGIESAAALANTLYQLRGETKSDDDCPTRSEVIKALVRYQDVRRRRANAYMDSAKLFTHLQALHSWTHRFMTWYLASIWENSTVELFSLHCQNAPKLNYLPTPQRSLTGYMPFNPSQGVGYEESMQRRFVAGVPFLVLAVIAYRSILPDTGAKSFVPYRKNETSDLFHFSYVMDCGALYTIFFIEAARPLANAWTLAALPTLVGMLSQRYSISVVSQPYFLMLYLVSRVELFRSSEVRLTNMRFTKAILPSMLLGFYIPQLLRFLLPNFAAYCRIDIFTSIFPLVVSGIQNLLAQVAYPNTWRHDRTHEPMRDYPCLRGTMGAIAVFSSTAWIFSRFMAARAWTDVLLPAYSTHHMDQIFTMLGASYWLFLCLWDFKVAGMEDQSGLQLIVKFVLLVYFAGPGTALTVGWLWRERILATRRHKDAVLVDDHEEFKEKWARPKA